MSHDDGDFLEIDLYNLHEEWVKQPGLFYRYSLEVADARRKLDEAKAELDVVTAEVDRDVRENPQDYGLEKVTEAAIKSAILASSEYRHATKAVIDARHAVGVYEAAASALEHRKKALEKSVDLFLADYFAEPRAKGEKAREAMEQESKRAVRNKGVRRK